MYDKVPHTLETCCLALVPSVCAVDTPLSSPPSRHTVGGDTSQVCQGFDLTGVWRSVVSVRPGWPGVSIRWQGKFDLKLPFQCGSTSLRYTGRVGGCWSS